MRARQLPETEDGFLGWVIDCARRQFGWTVAHFRPCQTGRGWRTAVQADGAGFPDLVLVRDRVIFAEVKSAGGQLEPEQRAWRDRIQGAGGEWHLWRPGDRDRITELLKREEMP